MSFVALKKVFHKPTYLVLAMATGGIVFAISTWLPNFRLIVEVMEHSQATLAQKIEFPLSLLGSITTNFSALSATYTILISILFGMNVAMLIYLLKNRVAAISKNGIATGTLGIVSGLLGVGCTACGSLILTGALSLVGAGGILYFLPLKGAEFGIIGVLLLLWSLYVIGERVESPITCPS